MKIKKTKTIILSLMTLVVLTSCSLKTPKIKSFYDNIDNQLIGVSYTNSGKQYSGIIDYQGNVIVSFAEQDVYIGDNLTYSVNNSNKSYLLKDGKKTSTNFKFITQFEDDTALAKSTNGKYGVINSSLEYIVDPIFSSIGFFHNGSYIVYDGDDKYVGYKNEYNLVDGIFVDYYVNEDSCIFYSVKKENESGIFKYALLDAKGSVQLDYKYDNIVFNNDIAIANNGDSYDLYDLTRKRIIATIDDGIIKAYSSSFYGVFDKNEKKTYMYIDGELIDSFDRETIVDCTKYYIVTSKDCMTDYGEGPCLFFHNKNNETLETKFYNDVTYTYDRYYICVSSNDNAIFYKDNFEKVRTLKNYDCVRIVNDYVLYCEYSISEINSDTYALYTNFYGAIFYQTYKGTVFKPHIYGNDYLFFQFANNITLCNISTGITVENYVGKLFLNNYNNYNAYIKKNVYDDTSTLCNLYGDELLSDKDYKFQNVYYYNNLIFI